MCFLFLQLDGNDLGVIWRVNMASELDQTGQKLVKIKKIMACSELVSKSLVTKAPSSIQG